MSTARSDWTPLATPLTRPVGTPTRFRFHKLDAQELRRRVWHMAPGLLPFVLWPIPHADPLSVTIRVVFVAIMALVTGQLFYRWQAVSRLEHGNADRATAIFGYAFSVLATLFLFPAHAELGLAVLGVLAFGDGSATLLGKLLGGPRLPWNAAKTVAGFLGFLMVGLPVTALIYWGESHNLEALGPAATASQALLIAAAGVVAGAIAESLPSRINDNIRVGVASATALVVAHAAVIGL